MFCLGMTAIAAATHKHEFSKVYESIMDQQHGYLHPLQYLQSQLSALTTFAYGSPREPGLDDKKTAPAKNEDFTEPDHQDVDDALEADQSPLDFVSITSRHKSVRRTVTSFQIAHPPPASKHKPRRKGHPRVLLQLRRISETRSPVPALEVLPSTLFASRLTRRFPTLLNGIVSLGVDDLVVVNSQSYDVADKENKLDEDSDEEHVANREVIAIISPPGKGDQKRKEHAQIWLAQGSAWTACPMANGGGYEFNAIDRYGLKRTARWVQKATKTKSVVLRTTISSPFDEELSKKFKFSILNPEARRHPVIASMDRYSIDVSDQYANPSTPSTLTPNSPAILSTHSQLNYFSEKPSPTVPVIEIDNESKTLAMVTGIWVAFVEGWSESFKYSLETGNSTSSVNTNSPWRNHAASGQFDNGDDARALTPQSVASSRSHHPSLSLRHRSTVSTHSTPAAKPRVTRHRSNSSGTVPIDTTEGFNISFNELGLDLSLRKPLRANHGPSRTDTVHSLRRNSTNKRISHPLMGARQFPVLEETMLNSEGRELIEAGKAEHGVERTVRASEDSRQSLSITSETGIASSTSSNPSRKKSGKVSRLLSYINKNKRRER